jgi:hypothetical protein
MPALPKRIDDFALRIGDLKSLEIINPKATIIKQ